jgi:Sulfotransferase family
MNVSDKVKCVWWAPQRNASRAVAALICKKYSFYVVKPLVQGKVTTHNPFVPLAPPEYKYTHTTGIPKGKNGYYLILNVRNPYSRVISFWLNRSRDTLLNWLTVPEEKYKNMPPGVMVDDYSTGLDIKKPDLLIRYEHLKDDVLKIPFVDFNDEYIKQQYQENIINNPFNGVDSRNFSKSQHEELLRITAKELKKEIPEALEKTLVAREVEAPWQSFYTEETANIVYENCKRQFDLFGYDKDSWKV